ncbi:MAG: glycosyltransferase family 4 protein [bacterium]
MPKGPPFGGMTAYASTILRSSLFTDDDRTLLDTTPPGETYSFFSRLFHSLILLWRLFKTLHVHHPRIVYFMTSSYLGFYEKGVMGLVSKMMGARVVFHFVGGGVRDFLSSTGLRSVLAKYFLRTASLVIVLSGEVRSLMGRIVPIEMISVLPNPVECDDYTSLKDSNSSGYKGPRILFSGAIVQEKGVLDLLDALRLARHKILDSKVTILGDGALYASCQKFVVDNGMADIVDLPGFVEEDTKKEFVRSSDIFVLPSYKEGIPIALLEAMAASCAIVSTTAGDIPVAVVHGENGFLVPPGDVSALADAIVKLVEDPQLRAMMGQKGCSRARKYFDAHVVMDQFAFLLERLRLQS